jgi:alpha-galactosidase
MTRSRSDSSRFCQFVLALLLLGAAAGILAANEPREGLNPSTDGSSATELAVPVRLPYEKVLPGAVTDYLMLTFTSPWGKEYMMQEAALPAEGYRFVQTKGRSCQDLKPYFMLYNTKTRQGIAVSVAYSGNWLIEVRPQNDETLLRVSASPAGSAPFDTIEGLPIPGALVAEFTGHWDYGAQPIVRFIRQKLLRHLGHDWPPVQYNTWYAAEDRFDEKSLYDSARAAAEIGCELFTIDAGWYGGHTKGNWGQGLGDWTVNRKKIPQGLEGIVKDVRQRGMKFGLWIEIECAAPKSPIAKQHPDWYLRDGDRQLSTRGVLDFGKPEVLDWAKSVIDDLMTRYQLDYIKMDFNTDPAVDGEHLAPGHDPLYGHYRGLAQLWKYMHEKYPRLIVENCSSGSLRQDAMSAALTDTHWVSDNVENAANLAMDHGATYLFPPDICNHWTVSPSRNVKGLDLETCFTVNMPGHFGLSGRITEWDAETMKIAAERIALYKKIRPVLCKADVFHLTRQASLTSPNTIQASLYVDSSDGKALLFAFQGGDPQMETTLKLRGLPPEGDYRVSFPAEFGPETVKSGKELVEQGLTLKFPRSGSSAVIQFERN